MLIRNFIKRFLTIVLLKVDSIDIFQDTSHSPSFELGGIPAKLIDC